MGYPKAPKDLLTHLLNSSLDQTLRYYQQYGYSPSPQILHNSWLVKKSLYFWGVIFFSSHFFQQMSRSLGSEETPQPNEKRGVPKLAPILGCPKTEVRMDQWLGSMVFWVISPTYKWGIPWGYNQLILTIDPNFQPDIQVGGSGRSRDRNIHGTSLS